MEVISSLSKFIMGVPFQKKEHFLTKEEKCQFLEELTLWRILLKKPQPIPANYSDDRWKWFKGNKGKEIKLTAKKRDKRTWTAEEEKLLIDILYDMNDSAWKVDTGHKSGYLTFIEKEMAKVLPNAKLKADPHIKSKVKILKKHLSYILEIQQTGSGFGWDDESKMVVGDRETYMGWTKSRDGAAALYMKPMVNFEKLCDVYASDLAKGGNAKGPGEQEVAEDEPIPNEAHMNSEPAGGVHEQTKDDNSTSSSGKQGRKRVYADSDGLETRLLNMSNSFAKYLESEKKNANTMADIGKALVHGVAVQQQTSANKSIYLDLMVIKL
ncbi:uncharacterized protein C2845_PM04G07830 [Panicum miliaceum]|uniref:Myb/SANT-like domain-containing protein n=1 Tax=Panicum miliaceum TaxID=4540 RepID=A0A3L6QRI8_PANMI|nr:uncharacterized protein C2845_PM04G07830 [Panicum miliaceum]